MTHTSNAYNLFEATMAELAKDMLGPMTDLGRCGDFPMGVWQTMGKEGLLDPDQLPQDRCCLAIARAARILTVQRGNLGMALSWMIHHLVAGALVRPHLKMSTGQKAWAEDLWKRIQTGSATVCLAVSEPHGGGHPKYMTTRAVAGPDGFTLVGEKTYLTNGPMASAYVVVAITGQSGRKKNFSAFLVDRDTPGLFVSDPMDIPFFRPSPHGSICMTDCLVSQDRILGQVGNAFPEFVLFFRQMEDAVMTGPVTGAMAFVLDAAAMALAKGQQVPETALTCLGRLKALVDTAVFLSDRVAAMADQKENHMESMILYFRQMAAQFLETMDNLVSDTGITLQGQAATMLSDLSSSARIGSTIANIKLKKLGNTLMDRSAQDRVPPLSHQ